MEFAGLEENGEGGKTGRRGHVGSEAGVVRLLGLKSGTAFNFSSSDNPNGRDNRSERRGTCRK
jgi:hypothetical protein